jgi:hypothetical protein
MKSGLVLGHVCWGAAADNTLVYRRHSIITRNSGDIRVAVETGAAWRHRGEGPTLSEVAMDYQVDARTGVWHKFSLAIKGACARGMWSHYLARYPEL